MTPSAAAALAGLVCGLVVAWVGRRGGYRQAGEAARVTWQWWLFAPALAGVWAGLAFRGWWALPAMGYAVAAGAAAVIDAEVSRLPDRLTAAAAVAAGGGALVAAAATSQWGRAGRAAVCGAALFVLFLALSFTGDMGGGDIKLSASTGLSLGSINVAAVVAGSLAGLALTAIAGVAIGVATRRGLHGRVPMGPGLVAGALAVAVAIR